MNTTRHSETIEVVTRDQRRRRWSLAEKQALVRRTYEPGMSVSLVARNEGVSASLLFQWRYSAPLRFAIPPGAPQRATTRSMREARPRWAEESRRLVESECV